MRITRTVSAVNALVRPHLSGWAWPRSASRSRPTSRPAAYGELAAAAEAHGFDVVSVFADLLDQPPLPALLEMARATSRVRLGAACLNPYTQHPYEIAGGLAALDAASRRPGLPRPGPRRVAGGDRHRAAPPAGSPARHRGDRARAAVRRRARVRRRGVPAGARGPAAVPASGPASRRCCWVPGGPRGRAGRARSPTRSRWAEAPTRRWCR